MADKYINGSGGGRFWKRVQDSFASMLSLINGKQNTISDLDEIRSGASAGATALQNIPVATTSTVGGIKASNAYGISVESGGTIKGINKSASDYASLGNNCIISKGTLNNVLASPSTMPTLTAAEQAAARARIGVRDLELIETVTYDGNTGAVYRNVTPSGTAYNFSSVMLVWNGNGSNVTQTAVIYANGSKLWGSDRVLLGYSASDSRERTVAEYDCDTGVFKSYSSPTGNVYQAAYATTYIQSGVDAITALEFQTNGVTPVSGATCKIYARWKN